MITVYLAVDGIAEGPFAIDPAKNLLGEIKRHFPKAKNTIAPKKINDGDVIVVSTK